MGLAPGLVGKTTPRLGMSAGLMQTWKKPIGDFNFDHMYGTIVGFSVEKPLRMRGSARPNWMASAGARRSVSELTLEKV
jgi:hypothetical protein